MDECTEFQYNYDDFMIKEKLCIECDKKFTNKYGVNMCRSCFQKYLITKTNAKRMYKLKDEDLNDLHEFTCHLAYGGGEGISYLLKEVRMKVLEKNFDLAEPIEIEEYQKYVKKFFRRMEKDKEKKEIMKANQKMMRKKKLKAALKKRGLEIRNDSYYCNEYINNNKFSLKKVSDMMEIMNFLFKKTKYVEIMDDMREDILDNYRYKLESPDLDIHVSLNEDQKEWAKKLAVEGYVKKYGKKKLPKSVLDEFYGDD